MTESNNEIDLIELYQKILVFIFKKFLTFVIFAVIGLLLGTAYYFKKSNIITTSYLAETSDISKELVYSLTEKISFSFETNDIDFLKSDLHLDEETLSEISKLSIDTTGNILNISIISTSKESLLPFTEALLSYYNNQPYILEAQKSKQEKKRKLIEKINEEITYINKIQEQFLNGNKDGKVTINQLNGSHSQKLNLYKMKQNCEDEIKKEDAISLINKGDNIIRKDISLFKTLAVSFIISIFFSFVFFFFRFSIDLKNKA